MYYEHKYEIGNGAWVGINNHIFDLGFKDEVLITGCSAYTHINKRLIAVKKFDCIFVYDYKTLKIGEIEILHRLAEFKTSEPNVYCKITFEGTTFCIDANCQVTVNSYKWMS